MTACSAKFQTFHNYGERFDRNLILEGHQAMHNNNDNGNSTEIFYMKFKKYDDVSARQNALAAEEAGGHHQDGEVGEVREVGGPGAPGGPHLQRRRVSDRGREPLQQQDIQGSVNT